MKHNRHKWHIFSDMKEQWLMHRPMRFQTMPCKFQLSSWMWLSTSLTSKRYSFHLWCLFHLLLSPSLSDIRQQRGEPALTFRTGAQLRSAINLLSVSVCLAACQCAHVGNNCDANTGQCICPPNTVGERCDKCAPNHWGHDISSGCKVRLISRLLFTLVCSRCVYLSSAKTSLLFIMSRRGESLS